MRALAFTSASIAGLLHILFFVMESVLWKRPAVHRRFGVRSQEEADLNAFALFNQGFYNLGLAAGVFVGIGLAVVDRPSGIPIMVYACSVMILAAVVLVSSRPAMTRAALIQGVPPLIAILAALGQ